MENSEYSKRQGLIDFWRLRCETARERYEMVNRRYRDLLEESPEGVVPGQNAPLALARQAESEALAEYTRILKLLTELTACGRILEEAKRIPTLAARCLIAVVDDDESVRDSTRTLLRSAGYEVSTFESGELFLKSETLSKTQCLVLDIRMPGMSGLELQRRVKMSESSLPVIFVTANYDEANRTLAMNDGAREVFQKPFSAGAFLSAVELALKNTADRPPRAAAY